MENIAVTSSFYTAIASDTDGDTVTYSLAGDDQTDFTLDEDTGALFFGTIPDYENPQDSNGDNIYDLILTANDNNGGITPLTLSVSVTDVVEAPNQAPIFSTVNDTVSFPENATTDVYVAVATDADTDPVSYGLVVGGDAALFTINPTDGKLVFITPPDFEIPTDTNIDNTYELTIQAADGKGGTALLVLSINVTDVFEIAPPVFTSANVVSIPENTADIFYTAAATATNNGTVSYSLSGADASLFSFNSVSGELAFITPADFEMPMDADKDNVYQLLVTAAEDIGSSNELAVAISITNVAENSAPSFNSLAAVSVMENAQGVFYTAVATDIDGQTPTYSISGGIDQALFSLDATAGTLSFSTSPDFEAPTDNDANNSYLLDISVSDGVGGVTALNLIVTVTDQSLLSVKITFPLENSSLAGTLTTMMAAGSLTDSEDGVVEADDVSVFDVNGVAATLNANDASRWTVSLPIGPTTLDITAMVESNSGATATANRRVDNSPLMLNSGKMIMDASNNRLLVGDGAIDSILAVDLSSGVKTIISGPHRGTGVIKDTFASPQSLALDALNKILYVMDGARKALMAVDMLTGNRTTVSRSDNVNAVGSGTDFNFAAGFAVAVDLDNSRVLVLDRTLPGIIAVDLATGNRSIISDNSGAKGTGPDYASPRAMVKDPNSNRVYVASSVVLEVDLATGNRVEISGSTVGTGESVSGLKDLVLDSANGTLWAVNGVGSNAMVLSIDIATGDRNIISGSTFSASFGSGIELQQPFSLGLDTSSNRILVVDQGGIIAVDLATLSLGNRTTLSNSSIGTGSSFFNMGEVVHDKANNRLLVANWFSTKQGAVKGEIIAVNLTSFNRTLLSGEGVGTGYLFTGVTGLTLDDINKRLYVAVMGLGVDSGLFMVDLTNGNRTVISGGTSSGVASVGSGPVMMFPTSVGLDLTNNRAIVSDAGVTTGLFTINLSTGVRAAWTGSGEILTAPSGIAMDYNNSRALVLDNSSGKLLAIELSSGLRSAINSDPVDAAFGSKLAFDPLDADRVFTLGDIGGTIAEINLLTGKLSYINDGSGFRTGPDFGQLGGFAYDRENSLFYLTSDQLDLVGVDDMDTNYTAIISK